MFDIKGNHLLPDVPFVLFETGIEEWDSPLSEPG
jgi:hypothetical protein